MEPVQPMIEDSKVESSENDPQPESAQADQKPEISITDELITEKSDIEKVEQDTNTVLVEETKAEILPVTDASLVDQVEHKSNENVETLNDSSTNDSPLDVNDEKIEVMASGDVQSDSKKESDNVNSKTVVNAQIETPAKSPVEPPISASSTSRSGYGMDDDLNCGSLLDKVILYSLKNVFPVTNNRLDVAKNKLMQSSGSFASSNLNVNSNSNSNSSNDAVMAENCDIVKPDLPQLDENCNSGGANVHKEEKLSYEKGDTIDCAKKMIANEEAIPSIAIEKVSEPIAVSVSKTPELSKISPVESSTSPSAIHSNFTVLETVEVAAQNIPSSSSEITDTSDVPKKLDSDKSSTKENLDFREANESATLDLTLPSREKIYDDKKVPPIKRNHALYTGIPDFSKQIFAAPSISSGATAIQAKSNDTSLLSLQMKTPDFSNVSRTPELQMRKPDFSKGFNAENSSDTVMGSSSVSVTPDNFAEISRKNNYISDLQLKLPSSAVAPPPAAVQPPSSYKIDFNPAASSQKILPQPEPPRMKQEIVYPNMKKDSINLHQQHQQSIDEPMAHIIHKNQFLVQPLLPEERKDITIQVNHAASSSANSIMPARPGGWNDRISHPSLLGGQAADAIMDKLVKQNYPYYENTSKDVTSKFPSSTSLPHDTKINQVPVKSVPKTMENQRQPKPLPEAYYPHQPHSSEDMRKYNPAHFQYSYNTKDSLEEQRQRDHEFSLKQKELQLRQEGTIITIKNETSQGHSRSEMMSSSHYSKSTALDGRPVKEPPDIYRDYKTKHLEHLPSKDSSIIQHTATINSSNSRSSYDPQTYQNHYQNIEAAYHNQQRYESSKGPSPAPGSYKLVDSRKSGTNISAVPYMMTDARGLSSKPIRSPIMQSPSPNSKDLRYDNYGSQGRAYESPSPVHQQLVRSPSIQGSTKQLDGRMNPPLNWPPQPSSSRVISSPVDRLNAQVNHLTSPSPTKFLQIPAKQSQSPTQSQGPQKVPPGQHMYNGPNMYSVQQQYLHQQHATAMGAQQQQSAKYGHGYPTKYPEMSQPPTKIVEGREYYSAQNPPLQQHPPQNMPYPSSGQRYEDSKSLQYVDFTRQFDKNKPTSASQESLNKYPVKDVSAYYQHPNELRHSSSDANINQYSALQRANLRPDIEIRKSDGDIRQRESSRSLEQSRYPTHDPMAIYQSSSSSHYGPEPSVSITDARASNSVDLKPKSVNDWYRSPQTSSLAMPQPVVIKSDVSQSYNQAIAPSSSMSYDRRNEVPTVPVVVKVKEESKISPVVESSAMSKPSSTSLIFGPVKRESPLDLSVKTVKTKADSTGCDDYARMRPETSGQQYSHKVEFTPNFTKPEHIVRPPNVDPSSQHMPSRAPYPSTNGMPPLHSIRNTSPVILKQPQLPNQTARREEYLGPSSNSAIQQGGRPFSEHDRPHAPIPQIDRPTNPMEIKFDGQRPGSSHFNGIDPRAPPMHIYPNKNVQSGTFPLQKPSNQRLPMKQSPPETSHSKKATSQLSKSSLEYERMMDRKYVENLLIPRASKISQAEQGPRNSRPMTPPKKRHIDQSHIHGPNPPKLAKIQEPPRNMYPYNPNPTQFTGPAQSSAPSNESFKKDYAYPQANRPDFSKMQYGMPLQPPMSNMQNDIRTAPGVIKREQPPTMPNAPNIPADIKYFQDQRHLNKDHVSSNTQNHLRGYPPTEPSKQPYQYGHFYPNPKSEMIHRLDSASGSSNYEQKPVINHYNQYNKMHSVYPNASSIPHTTTTEHTRLPYPPQNFCPRPDDSQIKGHPYNNNRKTTIINENVINVDHIPGQNSPFSDQPKVNGHVMVNSSLINNNSGSNGNIARGADQNTISKLRNSLELKELEKQKMRSQKNIEISEDDVKMDLSPKFRSKGALKSFNCYETCTAKTAISSTAAVPLEVKPPTSEGLLEFFKNPPFPLQSEADGGNGTTSALDLMDFGSACNDLVEQLQTGKKRGKRKRPIKKSDSELKMESSDQPAPQSDLPGTAANECSKVPIDIVKSINMEMKNDSSSDEDTPLLFLRQQSINSVVDTKTNSQKNELKEKITEKVYRNIREKQRFGLEQKIAARLGKPSSSESESETKKTLRTKKRVRRLRNRSSINLKKSCDENSEVETDENASNSQVIDLKRKKPDLDTSDSEPINMKKKISRAISTLENLTSSESEDGTTKAKINECIPKKSLDQKAKDSDNENKGKIVKSKKSCNSKLLEIKNANNNTSSESEQSDDEDSKTDKQPKSTNVKAGKKYKKFGEGFKKLLEEEETMTRSKRKLENEKKLSNSKILRNEKVVHNQITGRKTKVVDANAQSPTKKEKPGTQISTTKRKEIKMEESKRKIMDSESDDGKLKNRKNRRVSKLESSSEEESEPETVSDRLRPRKTKETEAMKPKDKTKEKAVKDEKSNEKVKAKPSVQCKIPLDGLMMSYSEDQKSNFGPGWEAGLYISKVSWKVPASLISIGRPPMHGISSSLPDLDASSDASETFSEFSKRFPLRKQDIKQENEEKFKNTESVKVIRKKLAASKERETEVLKVRKPEPRSIIDILHQRLMQTKKSKIRKSAGISKLTLNSTTKIDLSEIQRSDDKEVNVKKNIFETSVLKSRTRTENKANSSKEMIRKVFGSEERPASAPPLGFEQESLSFDQKYREYLEKMNAGYTKSSIKSLVKDPKIEKDGITTNDEDDNDTVMGEPLTDNATMPTSERDLTTPLPIPIKKKGRGIRTGRRKGSSGFDYIRKKKKPLPLNHVESPNSAANIIRKRMAAMDNLQAKDENDIGKEIKGWVLNKGVGESSLHKASRLGYIDVIIYCLDRLDMNPDPKDNAGYTPLHEACSKGHLDIARLLLQYGANHSETAHSGIRPLHEAVENGNIEIVRLLLSYGADPGLATYSGQTPLMIAEENKTMIEFLKSYLKDIGDTASFKVPWRFPGPYKIDYPEEMGNDIFENIPIESRTSGSSLTSTLSISTTSLITATTQMSDNETMTSETVTPIKGPTNNKMPSFENKIPTPITFEIGAIKAPNKFKRCDSNSNTIMQFNSSAETDQDSDKINNNENVKTGKKSDYKNCTVVLNRGIESKAKKLPKLPPPDTVPDAFIKNEMLSSTKEDYDDMVLDESDGELLEFELSEAPPPPLYELKDEGTEKWVLLSDLCNLLKVKSKEAVLKQICPNSPPAVNKKLLRELKMSDFLEKAVCLQFLCAGEKLNIQSSKVILVRYNDSVRNLLGVQTFLMNI